MFYVEKDNKIILFHEDETIIRDTLLCMPQYADLEIQETDRPIIDFEFADTDEYAQKQAQKERERLNMLSLTAADVERAIYKAKGMDFEDIIELVKDSPQIDIKALKIELKANNFYRGNPYVTAIGTILGYTSYDLDYLFENGELPEKEEIEE